MLRTNTSAIALAALLSAGTAGLVTAQTATDPADDAVVVDPAVPAEEAPATEAPATEAPAADGGADVTVIQEGDAEADGAVIAEEPAETMGTETTDVPVTGEGADVTVIEEGDAEVETDGAVVVEEPAEAAGTDTITSEPEGDTVITTEPIVTETETPGAEAVAPEGDVEVIVPEGDAAVVVDDAEAQAAEGEVPVEGQIFEQSPDQVLGSTLLDADVVSPDGETIGDVSDVVMSADGQITGVVIGVGGFLGIGERRVAVEYDQIEVRQEDVGTLTFVLNATREQIEAAPEFRTQLDIEAETAPTAGTALQEDPTIPTGGAGTLGADPAAPVGTVVEPVE